MLIGYMRVSKADGSQATDLQRDALVAAGVDPAQLYEDQASGKREDRPGLASCLKALRPGDTLVVWKLDRLGRDLRHLINTVHDLTGRGIGLKVLTGHGAAIDTTTAAGKLVFGIFAALAEFERELIAERTIAGLASARAPAPEPEGGIPAGAGGRDPASRQLANGVPGLAPAQPRGPRGGPATAYRVLRGIERGEVADRRETAPGIERHALVAAEGRRLADVLEEQVLLGALGRAGAEGAVVAGLTSAGAGLLAGVGGTGGVNLGRQVLLVAVLRAVQDAAHARDRPARDLAVELDRATGSGDKALLPDGVELGAVVGQDLKVKRAEHVLGVLHAGTGLSRPTPAARAAAAARRSIPYFASNAAVRPSCSPWWPRHRSATSSLLLLQPPIPRVWTTWAMSGSPAQQGVQPCGIIFAP